MSTNCTKNRNRQGWVVTLLHGLLRIFFQSRSVFSYQPGLRLVGCCACSTTFVLHTLETKNVGCAVDGEVAGGGSATGTWSLASALLVSRVRALQLEGMPCAAVGLRWCAAGPANPPQSHVMGWEFVLRTQVA